MPCPAWILRTCLKIWIPCPCIFYSHIFISHLLDYSPWLEVGLCKHCINVTSTLHKLALNDKIIIKVYCKSICEIERDLKAKARFCLANGNMIDHTTGEFAKSVNCSKGDTDDFSVVEVFSKYVFKLCRLFWTPSLAKVFHSNHLCLSMR